MSLIKKEIADFSVQAYHNNDFITVKKSDVMGKWSVFFFYPGDFTFVCPTELEDLQSRYADFKNIGCEIYTISTDSHFVHKQWHESSERISKVEYPMLADRTHEMSRSFDAYIAEEGASERATFIVNPEGKIAAYEFHEGDVGRNAEELFRKVQALQFVYENDGLVCPARWRPGEKALKPDLNLVGRL